VHFTFIILLHIGLTKKDITKLMSHQDNDIQRLAIMLVDRILKRLSAHLSRASEPSRGRCMPDDRLDVTAVGQAQLIKYLPDFVTLTAAWNRLV
jgi:hypothetical protein